MLPGDEIGLKQQTMTGTYATAQAGETLTLSLIHILARSMLRAAASGKPQLSADAQWIEGLDGNYQYITKDTYCLLYTSRCV